MENGAFIWKTKVFIKCRLASVKVRVMIPFFFVFCLFKLYHIVDKEVL